MDKIGRQLPLNLKHFGYIVQVSILLVLQSCSNELAFEAIRSRQKIECQQLPPAQYAECMEGLNESYKSYKQKRDELNAE